MSRKSFISVFIAISVTVICLVLALRDYPWGSSMVADQPTAVHPLPPVATTTSPSKSDCNYDPGFSTDDKSVARDPLLPSQGLYLANIVAKDACVDVFIVDIATSQEVGYTVGYGAPVADGSGKLVDVRGAQVLRVAIGAHVSRDPDSAVQVKQFDQSKPPIIAQAVYGGESEGVTTFFLGLDQKRPFKVIYSNETRGLTQVVVLVAKVNGNAI
jgi:hypothetical protein